MIVQETNSHLDDAIGDTPASPVQGQWVFSFLPQRPYFPTSRRRKPWAFRKRLLHPVTQNEQLGVDTVRDASEPAPAKTKFLAFPKNDLNTSAAIRHQCATPW